MRAAPDGHTFLYTLAAGLMTAPLLLKERPYDALKDFSHVTHAMDGVTGLMVSTSLPIDSMQSLIEHVRANPGKLAYGSNGIGSNFHLEMELLKSRVTGLDVTHVPYKVSTGAVQALIAGQIPIALSPVAIGLPHARAGKLRIIAILDSKRYSGLPDIPSMAEQVSGYERPPSGMRVFGPAGVPPAVVRRFQSEIAAALSAPETQARLREIHFGAVGNTPEQFTAQMRREMDILARALQLAGLKPE
jgi:tripartite-type tricarboxylate transporter receptor subunit TctC